MFALLKKVFDNNARDVEKLRRQVVLPANALEAEISQITDLAAEYANLRAQVASGEKTLEDLAFQARAFALIREAAKRSIGKRHYDVQLLGAAALHRGRIAEMRTGEGKTLVATLALAYNALEGKGCHLVTVNDYLAKVGAEEMGLVYRTLGLSVGLIQHHLQPFERKIAYACDITYVTNSELGFDYLRDNMAQDPEQLVLRADTPLHFSIVDEVDSILIDEARTPLIISGQAEKATDQYRLMSKLVKRLKRGEPVEPGVRTEPTGDYTIDEKSKAVHLTEQGIDRIENFLSLDDLYSMNNMEKAHMIVQALRSKDLYFLDKDYIIDEKGEIVIVDEFTGRLMPGRRYGEGLHQAIEAKEGVTIQNENQTLATITYQNFFRLYNKFGGMTGTAKTEEKEFIDIYGVDVLTIPTNLPVIRKDHEDLIYRTKMGKFKATVDEIEKIHATGRPILVGTASIETSEQLSSLLTEKNITHRVLNAKHHAQEAAIVAQAGRSNTVTIATNMAGRGTDIMLGGNAEHISGDLLEGVGLSRYAPEVEDFTKAVLRKDAQAMEYGLRLPGVSEELVKQILEIRDTCEADRATVRAAGGLHIIGTERHESRRIDNQLRGRAGRQGDPGSSRFYVSFEDDLMRLFANERVIAMLDRLGMDDSQPIEAGMVTKSIEGAQARVEDRNFSVRKQLLEFDNVMSKQREIIYAQRREVLLGKDEDVLESVEGMMGDAIEHALDIHAPSDISPDEWKLEELKAALTELIPAYEAFDLERVGKATVDEAHKYAIEFAADALDARRAAIGEGTLVGLSRYVLLQVVDQYWKEHLHNMDVLRQGIGLRGYGQRDPFQEYKFEATNMFNTMIDNLKAEVTKFMFRLQVGE